MYASEEVADKNKNEYRHYRLKGKTENFSHKITPKYYSEVILAQKSTVYKIIDKYL